MGHALDRLPLIAFGQSYLRPVHQDSPPDGGNLEAPSGGMFSSRSPWETLFTRRNAEKLTLRPSVIPMK